MSPRCDSSSVQSCVSHAPHGFVARGWLLVVAFVLAACGSTPSSDRDVVAASGADARPAGNSDAAAVQAGSLDEPLPPEAVQQFDAAVIRMNAGDHATAEQAFRAIAAEYPKYSGALVNLGILQTTQGRLEDAQQSLQAALQRNASNATAHNQLGIVYRKLGRFQEADQSYQRAVQADPTYANAYLNLGVLCDLYLQQPERALEAYERYLEVASAPDERVKTWVDQLRKRLGAEPRAARSE